MHPLSWYGTRWLNKAMFSFFSSKVISEEHKENLGRFILPSSKNLCDDDFVFQQNSAFLHAEKFHQLTTLNVPLSSSNSPELNPVENLWGVTRRWHYKDAPRDKKDRISSLKKIYFNFYKKIFLPWISNTPNHLRTVIKAKGDEIKF